MRFGKNLQFGYGGIAVVIHKNCVLGDNVSIAQSVTIGGRSRKPQVPKIGDNVVISAGSVVIGDITIVNNVIIGANSTVLNSIPDNTIVAGNPARVIKSDIKSIKEYV